MDDKFVESFDVNDYEVLSDNGFVDIISSHKTIPFVVWEIETDSCKLRCADDHILFDENFNEIFTKNLVYGQGIQTERGVEKITKITETKNMENMYDLELPYISNHRYFTNGILSHNTMSLVSLGASYVRNGVNVLYITCEMSEDKIAQLFDANFIDMEINDIPSMSYETFSGRVTDAQRDSYGRLFIREFPTATENVMNISSLIDDLKLKENFMPEVVIVDYINLMLSMRVTDGKSYTIIKYIAEELRGLAIERNIAVLTATQLNREGAGNTNPSLRETAESYGLPQTADAMFIIYANDELASKNLIIWKSAKNRFGGIVGHKMVFRTKFNYATVLNLEEQTDGIPFIKNNEKTVAMMNKMQERIHSKKNNTENTGINSMFS